MNGQQVEKLRFAIIVLIAVIVFVASAIPIVTLTIQQRQADRQIQVISCAIIRSENRTHKDLADIRRVLGLPPGPPIPEVPEECDGS